MKRTRRERLAHARRLVINAIRRHPRQMETLAPEPRVVVVRIATDALERRLKVEDQLRKTINWYERNWNRVAHGR